MDEIKHKIRSFIHKQGSQTSHIPSMGFSEASYQCGSREASMFMSVNSRTTVTECDRPSDQDILESIEAAYFSMDESLDIGQFECEKQHTPLDRDRIYSDYGRLKQQHQVVSKKVLQLILEKQSACWAQVEGMRTILDNISSTLELCREVRRHLGVVLKDVSNGLMVRRNCRKRYLAGRVLQHLNMIRELGGFNVRVRQLMEDQDYVGGVLELKNSLRMAADNQQFECVKELQNRIQEMLEGADDRLDRILAQMCLDFDAKRFRVLQDAFKLLGKTEIDIQDSLHVHFITAIYNTSLRIVHSYATNTPESTFANNAIPVTDCSNPYKLMCQNIDDGERLIACLLHLCKNLFQIVLSYHQLVRWYQERDDNSTSACYSEIADNHTTSQVKLENNLNKIWDDVQRKVSNLLVNAQLAHYKFEQFLQVLAIINRLIEVGDEFCGSVSLDLQKSIREQSLNYFNNYHTQRLEEVCIFLDNETWKLCPVKESFSMLKLQEFRHIRSFKVNHTPHSDCCSSNQSHEDGGSSSLLGGNYLARYTHCSKGGNPFDSLSRRWDAVDDSSFANDLEDVLQFTPTDASCYFSDDDDDDDDNTSNSDCECMELRDAKYCEDGHKSDQQQQSQRQSQSDNHIVPGERARGVTSHSDCRILANATLLVLRQMGKYVQMARLLKCIAHQVISSMNQLYNNYLWTVHDMFTKDLILQSSNLYSDTLHLTLQKFHAISQHSDNTKKSNVNLSCAEQLFGLAERIVAVESVVFLAQQYEQMEEWLLYLLSDNSKEDLDHFYKQNISCAPDLRQPVYMASVSQSFDLSQMLSNISKVNWDVKDVPTQHNVYVDVILREAQIFTLRLQDVHKRVPVSDLVNCTLWRNISHILTHALVQGFSEVKRCSNGGRALMQLDFTQLQSKLEKMSGLKPMPHREYVDNYVKAFYLPDSELQNWIQEHVEYSVKQRIGLVNCACQGNKKAKQRLLLVLEQHEKRTHKS